MDELFPFALEAGIQVDKYWYLTITEINAAILAYKSKLSTQAAMDYKLADLIGLSVNRLLNKGAKFPTIYEAYPGLVEPERPKDQDWQIAKERLLRYATAHNAKHRGE